MNPRTLDKSEKSTPFFRLGGAAQLALAWAVLTTTAACAVGSTDILESSDSNLLRASTPGTYYFARHLEDDDFVTCVYQRNTRVGTFGISSKAATTFSEEQGKIFSAQADREASAGDLGAADRYTIATFSMVNVGYYLFLGGNKSVDAAQLRYLQKLIARAADTSTNNGVRYACASSLQSELNKWK
jgi:hypothetical protein